MPFWPLSAGRSSFLPLELGRQRVVAEATATVHPGGAGGKRKDLHGGVAVLPVYYETARVHYGRGAIFNAGIDYGILMRHGDRTQDAPSEPEGDR